MKRLTSAAITFGRVRGPLAAGLAALPQLIASAAGFGATAAGTGGAALSASATAAGAAATAAGGAAGATAAGSSGILAGLQAGAALAGGTAALAQAFKKGPQVPTPPQAPQAPSFASNLGGGTNKALAGLDPASALGSTNRGVFSTAGVGTGKTLLGS